MNQLFGILDRIERADEHIEQTKELLRDYYGDLSIGLTGEFDPEAKRIQYLFEAPVEAPTPRLGTISGEVLHDLRSALDHLTWALVEENGAGTASDKTCFPVLKVAPTANKKGVSPPPFVAGGVSSTALALIDREQPYQVGEDYPGDALYILHELNNIDKHRHVSIRGVRSLGSYLAGGTPKFTFNAQIVSTSEHGAEISFVPDDPSVDVDFRTTFQLMVHEVAPDIYLPLLEALVDARERVMSIVGEAIRTCLPNGSAAGNEQGHGRDSAPASE